MHGLSSCSSFIDSFCLHMFMLAVKGLSPPAHGRNVLAISCGLPSPDLLAQTRPHTRIQLTRTSCQTATPPQLITHTLIHAHTNKVSPEASFPDSIKANTSTESTVWPLDCYRCWCAHAYHTHTWCISWRSEVTQTCRPSLVCLNLPHTHTHTNFPSTVFRCILSGRTCSSSGHLCLSLSGRCQEARPQSATTIKVKPAILLLWTALSNFPM